MREIKFRAWDKKEQKMWFNQFTITSYGYIQKSEPAREYHSWKDEDWILLQYTGLKDKNDKEIYEGDIVVVSKMPPEVVSFERGAFICSQDDYPLNFSLLTLTNQQDIEVVGNIYESPQFLLSHKDGRKEEK